MGKSIVVNINAGETYDVYIGRGYGSIWGNPFSLAENSRNEAIEKYRRFITEKLRRSPALRDELLKLKGKRLGCFCKPKKCHGDVLVELIESLENDNLWHGSQTE